jgi:hypothetical protein
MKTPVIFLIFNRPTKTKQVFEAIRQAKPSQLLVIADGARGDRPGEAAKCEETKAVINGVDWDCQVLTNYADTNLGLKTRISSGLTWAFSQVEEAIILEDDCLPEPSFFRFCEELLQYYRHDERIGTISGLNLQFGKKRNDYSYYFSRYHYSWGWATWRRAWQHFDLDMKLWPLVRDGNWLRDILDSDRQAVRYWEIIMQGAYEHELKTWDYPWLFSFWLQGYSTIVPNLNLMRNLGFDGEGTHTFDPNSKFANLKTENISFPLQHPPFVIRDLQADNFIQKTLYDDLDYVNLFKSRLKKFLISQKLLKLEQ